MQLSIFLIIVTERLDSNPIFPKKKKKKDQYTNNIKEPRKYENTHTLNAR